jgi:hypothetical protein
MRIASGIFDSSSLPTHSFLLGFPSYFIHRDLGLVYSSLTFTPIYMIYYDEVCYSWYNILGFIYYTLLG